MLRCCFYRSPIGALLPVEEKGALVGLRMEGQRVGGGSYWENLPPPTEPVGVLAAAVCWLDAYFEGKRPVPADLVLEPRGSVFQRRVWQELCRIPYGATCTYGELARRLGSSARAVGGALGRNPLCIIVPCHRVVAAGGALGGYAGGEDRKRFLLAWEEKSFDGGCRRC